MISERPALLAFTAELVYIHTIAAKLSYVLNIAAYLIDIRIEDTFNLGESSVIIHIYTSCLRLELEGGCSCYEN